jgi:hypothetical protein
MTHEDLVLAFELGGTGRFVVAPLLFAFMSVSDHRCPFCGCMYSRGRANRS